MESLDPKDGGYASRKLWYSVGTSIAIVVVGTFSGFWPPFRPGLETVVGGLLGVLALYLGGNVSNKWVVAKNLVTKTAEEAAKKIDAAREDKPSVEEAE